MGKHLPGNSDEGYGKRIVAKIVINRDRCKGCSFCVDACPKDLIKIDMELNIQGYLPATIEDNDNCTGCALCAEVCPDVAIEVYK
ncbi:MAG: 4Fe-4S binding protein [Pseudomonadota bacterium]